MEQITLDSVKIAVVRIAPHYIIDKDGNVYSIYGNFKKMSKHFLHNRYWVKLTIAKGVKKWFRVDKLLKQYWGIPTNEYMRTPKENRLNKMKRE